MSKDAASAPAEANEPLVTSAEDKAKAAKWFERARELGDKRQFDYAVEYYVNGLEFWPDAVEEACKPLHGCAIARKATGGKKPGIKDTMKRSMSDKAAKQAFINSLWLFSHDPDHVGYIEGAVRAAMRLRAEQAARWAAGVWLKLLESNPKSTGKQFQALAELMDELGDRAVARDDAPAAVAAFQLGVDAVSVWKRKIGKDPTADNVLKNLSTKLTIHKGKYQSGESFRDSIRDRGDQRDLQDEQRSVQADERFEELIAKAEAEHQANPTDISLKKYVDLLCRRERESDEMRAIGLLVNEYKRTNQYRWKQLADDVRMKQLARKERELRASGDDEAYKKHQIDQLRYELSVFRERVERYPTDVRMKFEYAVRNFRAGRIDEAIPLLQTARNDPKNRIACGLYLGRCFYKKGYYSQAVTTLRESIESYEISDDDLAKEMLFWMGRSQEAAGDVKGARETYGRIVQIDYNYRDVRDRLDRLPPE